MELIERTIDPEGRVLLPKRWREEHGRHILVIETPEYVRIVPMKKRKLSDLFDKAEVELEAKLTDWKAVKRELFAKVAE